MNSTTKITPLAVLLIVIVPLMASAGEWEGPCYKADGNICAAGNEADGTPNVRCDDVVYSGVSWKQICIYSCDDEFNYQAWSTDRDRGVFFEHCYQDDEIHSKKLARCREIHGAQATVGTDGKCTCQPYYGSDSVEPFKCVLVGQKCEPTTIYSASKATETGCRCPSGASLGQDNLTCFPVDARPNSEGSVNAVSLTPEQPLVETVEIQDEPGVSVGAPEQTNGVQESVQQLVPTKRSWIQRVVDFFRSFFAELVA